MSYCEFIEPFCWPMVLARLRRLVQDTFVSEMICSPEGFHVHMCVFPLLHLRSEGLEETCVGQEHAAENA